MNRSELIRSTKALLDEFSPFEEPDEFIDGIDDEDMKLVKPIVSYIEDQLDKATSYCLNTLPFTILGEDIETEELTVHIDHKGVGHIHDFDTYVRLCRVAVLEEDVWSRSVTSFFSSQSQQYILQQDVNVRGGVDKPAVAFVPEKNELQLYSFPMSMTPKDKCDQAHTHASVSYINPRVRADKVRSHIEEYICLMCASYVAEILENPDTSKRLQTRFATKLESILR